MDRRAFLGSALGLAGCATLHDPGPRLARVRVAPERVIRTAAGLRPYRAEGFVVRADLVGDQRVVHNYGHGGAGITLSWGTAKLAVDLGLPGHEGAVAVIGAGVAGLTTARLVQEAGFPVTVYAAALPPETTSNVAGGQFHPFRHFEAALVTPAWRTQYEAALAFSWRRLQLLVGDDYGVRWLPTYFQADHGLDEQVLPTFPTAQRLLDHRDHPFPLARVARYDTLYVETGRYLRQLVRDLELAGGTLKVRRFATPADLAALPEKLVFHCTGLGAHGLFGDTALHPVRGQLALLLPQPEVQYAFAGAAGYMFPRPDGIVIGGTYERDVWDATPQPADIARIVASHQALFARFRG